LEQKDKRKTILVHGNKPPSIQMMGKEKKRTKTSGEKRACQGHKEERIITYCRPEKGGSERKRAQPLSTDSHRPSRITTNNRTGKS